jgi:hypothetical protein
LGGLDRYARALVPKFLTQNLGPAYEFRFNTAVVFGNVLLLAGSKAQAESTDRAQFKKKRFLKYFLSD